MASNARSDARYALHHYKPSLEKRSQVSGLDVLRYRFGGIQDFSHLSFTTFVKLGAGLPMKWLSRVAKAPDVVTKSAFRLESSGG